MQKKILIRLIIITFILSPLFILSCATELSMLKEARTLEDYIDIKNKYPKGEFIIEVENKIRELSKPILYINVNPRTSVIKFLNNDQPFKQGMRLDPGKYIIEVSREFYNTAKESIHLKENETKKINVKLKRKTAKNRFETKYYVKDKVIVDYQNWVMWLQDKIIFEPEDKRFSGLNSYRVLQKNLLEKINSMFYAGHNNWRFPNYNEVLSLVEKERVKTIIEPYDDPHNKLVFFERKYFHAKNPIQTFCNDKYKGRYCKPCGESNSEYSASCYGYTFMHRLFYRPQPGIVFGVYALPPDLSILKINKKNLMVVNFYSGKKKFVSLTAHAGFLMPVRSLD